MMEAFILVIMICKLLVATFWTGIGAFFAKLAWVSVNIAQWCLERSNAVLDELYE